MKTVLLFLMLFSVGCTTETVTHGVPNLSWVAPNVWRGGQPKDAKAWAYLRSLGITHDIKLNTDSEGCDDAAYEAGMFVHKFPISFWRQIIGPRQDTIDGAVYWATEFPFGVFIHCSHGQDRTGLVVASYLHEVECWSKERARTNMLAHDFHRSLLGLDWYWREQVK